MESISIVPSTVLNSIYVNERKNCTGGSVVLEDRYTVYFMQVTDTTNISIDSSLLNVPTNCSVQFKLVVWSNKANVLNFSGCSIEQIEVRRGESVFTVQWTPGVNIWAVMPDVLSGYNEVPLLAWSRPYSTAQAIASQRGLTSYSNNSDLFDVFCFVPYDANSGNWDYGPNNHNNSTAYVWSIKPFMIRSLQLHFLSNSDAKYFPSTFSVYGTNDHKTWTAILSNVEVSYVSGGIQTVSVTGSNNFYRAFRFEFTQNNTEQSRIFPITIIGYEGNLIDNRHYDWMIPAISSASGGYTATVDTSNLADVSGNAYTLLMGNSFFYARKTSGLAWTFTYELPIAKKPCGIYLKTRGNSYGESCIGTMAIFGSNDSGTTWTKILDVDSGALYGGAPGGSQDFTYMFNCATAYNNFKVEVYSPYNGGTGLHITAFNFITEVADINTTYDTIMPVMSSDSQDGYVVSVTNTVDSTSAYMMFDGLTTDYCGGTWNNGQWVVNIQLPQATVLNGIRMVSRASGYDCTPYAFSFQGSNNFTDWTVLESWNLGSSYWNAGGKLGTFAFPNTTAYTYYRLVCTASGSNSYCVISELGLTANAYLPSVNWTEDVYIVPVMSAASQDGYVASASSEYDGSHHAYNAFDGSTYNKWASSGSDSDAWLQIQLPTAQICNVITLNSGTDGNYYGECPTQFEFKGSNDGTNWTTLTSQTGVTWTSAGQNKTFEFSNSTAYSYYRLTISENGNGYAPFSVGELYIINRITHTN